MPISFFVAGDPVPKGSKKVFMVKGRPILVDQQGKALKAWESEVAARAPGDHIYGAVSVCLTFYLRRPRSVRRRWHTVPYDVDKLARAVNDSLTRSGVIEDDSRIVELVARKLYADECEPGVFIEVDSLGV